MSYSPYDSHNHVSPTLDGKKNSAFLNPNLRSSNVFYDYDYSYKNDMHNPRLLSSVKNDKFGTPSRDDRYETKSTYEKTPSERGDRPSTAYNTVKKTWDTESNNGDSDYYQAPLNRQRGSVPNIRTEPATRAGATRAKDFESLSTINEEPSAMNARTLKTTRPPGKYCLDCVNQHLSSKQRCQKDDHKANDTQHMKEWVAHETKKASYNHDKARQDNTIARKQQVETKSHAAFHEFNRAYGKSQPEIEGGVVIDAIFDRHEERNRQNKQNERTLRSYNYDKMVDTEANRDVQRLDRLTSEHNSLQVGEVFVNKYLPTSGSLTSDLIQQMDSNAVRNARNKEAEQRRDQEILEANRAAMEREKQAKQEKVENYRRMLSDQLEARNQVKEAEKEKARVDKEKARYYGQKAVEDHSAKLQDKESNKQRDKAMFMNSLKEQQQQNQEAGYRKMYADKKSKLQGNGVTLKLAEKPQMDSCLGCKKEKEASQLTHFDHSKH